MRRTILCIILISLCTGFRATASAQELADLEEQFRGQYKQYLLEKNRLDSLNHLLEDRVGNIEDERAQAPVDESRVQEMLAGSVVISGQIEKQQNTVSEINRLLDNTRNRLIGRYEEEIAALKDSLSRDVPPQKKTGMERRIFSLLEKKLAVAPRIPSLTFHPDKLRELDTAMLQDSLQRKIYIEYLQRAKAEINQKMIDVEKDLAEIEEVIVLEEKAVEFLDEMDMLSVYSPLGAASSQTRTMDANPSETFRELKSDRILPRIPGYITLLNQLKRDESESVIFTQVSPSDSSRLYVTYTEYRRLLEELVTRLSDYDILLDKKLGDTY